MAIDLEEYDAISKQMPKRGKGDEIELSEEDEQALDKAWEMLAREKDIKPKRPSVRQQVSRKKI